MASEAVIDDAEAAELTSVKAVSALARRMYGGDPRSGGVIHPTAVWQPAGDAVCYRVLKITGATPRSHHDAFALNLARARADAILTTGKNLRQEPELTHGFLGSRRTGQALAGWRREVRARSEPPWSVVLTSGRDVDLDHPLFAGPGQAVLYTGEDGAKRLRDGAVQRDIRVVADPLPDLRRAVAWLQRQGLGTISIEAGPSSACDLYKHTRMVEELLLSEYQGPLPAKLRGGEFLKAEALAQMFPCRSKDFTVSTTEGEWRFRRHG